MRTFFLGLLLLSCACGGEDREAREAKLFLDRVRAIDISDPVETRQERVDALERLVLSTERVKEARDVCLRFHRSLLDAETGAAEVRSALDALPPEQQHAGPETSRIAQRLRESNAAAAQAERLQPECEAKTASLATRYQPRR